MFLENEVEHRLFVLFHDKARACHHLLLHRAKTLFSLVRLLFPSRNSFSRCFQNGGSNLVTLRDLVSALGFTSDEQRRTVVACAFSLPVPTNIDGAL